MTDTTVADRRREDAQLERLLTAALSRAEPTAEQLERWRGAFAVELAAVRRRRGRRLTTLAAAAAAAALVLLALWPREVDLPAEPVARVVAVLGAAAAAAEHGPRRLRPGDVVRAGERVQSGPRSGLGVSYRGADVRLDEQTVLVFHEDRLALLRGGVYLDTGEDAGRVNKAVLVETPAAVVSHAGTQFVVRVSQSEVIAAVREGSIVLRHASGDLRLTALPEHARMVVVGRQGPIRQQDAESAGALWSWALASSAGMSLEGRAADEVLRWAAREQGRRLVYADAEAERIAQAPLAGDRAPVDPLQAVAVVAAATGLEVHAEAGVLRVTLASEGDEHAR